MDRKSSPTVLIPANPLQARAAMDLAFAITVTVQDSDVHCLAFRCPGTSVLWVQCTCEWQSVDHKAGFFCSAEIQKWGFY